MPINKVRRDDSSSLDFSDIVQNTLYFKSIQDQQKDNIFDIIDKDNYDEYYKPKEGRQSDVVKKYRNKLKKPILLIYLAHSNKAPEIEVFPLFYCFIPALEKTHKVTYILRN